MKTTILTIALFVFTLSTNAQDFYNKKYRLGQESSNKWYKLFDIDLNGNGNHNSVNIEVAFNYVNTRNKYNSNAIIRLRENSKSDWQNNVTGLKQPVLKFKKTSANTYELWGYSNGNYGHFSFESKITKEAEFIINIPEEPVLIPDADLYEDVPNVGDWYYSTGDFIVDEGNVGIGTTNPKAKLSVADQSLLNFDWTREPNWGGSANKWSGYIGFNSYRNNDELKDYFFRSNNYTKRMALEGGNYGFRWLGESDVPDWGTGTVARKLNELMKLSDQGSLSIDNQLLNLGWTYDTNWGGSANKWSGYIGFNAHRKDNEAKDYFRRTNNYTKRMVFESGNNGFRWLGENEVPDRGNNTGSKKLNELMKLTSEGNAALSGKFEAKEIKVTLTPTADFVFEEDYDLPTLEFINNHIKENKHLPEIASAKKMIENGVNIGEFQIKLLQKIEELTLYTIDQQKEIELQNSTLHQLQTRLEKLESEK